MRTNTLFLKLLILLSFCRLSEAAKPCHALVNLIGKHIHWGQMDGADRERLRFTGSILTDVLDKSGPEFAQALQMLVRMPREQTTKIADNFSRADTMTQVALLGRMRDAAQAGQHQIVGQILALTGRLNDPTVKVVELRSQHSDLEESIQTAARELPGIGSPLFSHILGEDNVLLGGLPAMKGGGHTHEGWEQLAKGRLTAVSKEGKRLLEAALGDLIPGNVIRREIVDLYREMGFAFPDDGTSDLLLSQKQLLWGLEKRPNGVVNLLLPYDQLGQKAWAATEGAARYGVIPIGGKSLFPVGWDANSIRAGILSVLRNPDSRIVRRTKKGNQHSFYVVGSHQGIQIEVGVTGGRVGTAFPSWRQYSPETPRDAYYQWQYSVGRLADVGSYLNFQKYAETDIKAPWDMVTLYFNGKVPYLPESDATILKNWLCPRYLQDSPDFSKARGFQTAIWEYVQRTQILRQLEGWEGPVYSPAP